MNMNVHPHVFLSYTRRDAEIMHRVRDTLRDEGLNVWVDEGIEPGTPLWDRAVEDGLKTANCMLVILTPNVIDSKGVRDEIHFAGLHHVHIFTALAQGEPSAAIPYTLSGNQFVDIRTNYTTNMARLITAIQNHLGLEIEKSTDSDVPAPVQSKPKEQFVTSKLVSVMPKQPLISIVMNGLFYFLAVSLLIIGGLGIGQASAMTAYYRYLAFVKYDADYYISAGREFELAVLIVTIDAVIFPYIHHWLLRKQLSAQWIYVFIIFPALLLAFIWDTHYQPESMLFTLVALLFTIYILPTLFRNLRRIFVQT
jgi:hypothetical protein